jgi:tetratricopeptide (TPR) repeat protein
MRSLYKSLPVGVIIAFLPLAALAEEPAQQYPDCDHQPSEGEISGAKGAFQAGQASFEEGDYPRAISYWEDAYRRDCTAHALLLNLARAYELNNQKHHAVVALQTYLSRNPSAPQRDLIARRIEGLNEKIAREEQAPTPSSTATAPPPATTGGPAKPPPPGAKRPITPLIVAGAGGAVMLIGGLLYLKAQGDINKVQDQCGGSNCPGQPDLAKQGNDARSRRNLWGGVTFIGFAAAVGGTIWYFLTPPKPAESAKRTHHQKLGLPSVEPVVGNGFTGLTLSGAF